MRINTPYTRDLIRRLNAAAITVLSNPTEVLPLDPDIKDVPEFSPAVGTILSVVFISMYPLTEKKMKDITTELECKRQL